MATRVKFLRDFRGVWTGENFFQAGDVWEFEDGNAQGLVAEGAAELTKAPLFFEGKPVSTMPPKKKPTIAQIYKAAEKAGLKPDELQITSEQPTWEEVNAAIAAAQAIKGKTPERTAAESDNPVSHTEGGGG